MHSDTSENYKQRTRAAARYTGGRRARAAPWRAPKAYNARSQGSAPGPRRGERAVGRRGRRLGRAPGRLPRLQLRDDRVQVPAPRRTLRRRLGARLAQTPNRYFSPRYIRHGSRVPGALFQGYAACRRLRLLIAASLFSRASTRKYCCAWGSGAGVKRGSASMRSPHRISWNAQV